MPKTKPFSVFLLMSLVLLILSLSLPAKAHGPTPISLKGIKVPLTPGLLDGKNPIIVDEIAALQLGKALFWDVNVGSDGMACASCHFHAGADARFINQLSPGMPRKNSKTTTTFQAMASGRLGSVNNTPNISDFPFYQLSDSADQDSKVIFSSDDVFSSAGVFLRTFKQTNTTQDDCVTQTDTIFHLGDLNTRQVQSRNSPSVINAAFNFRNFWDGRANNIFNGVSPFGVRDVNAGIWIVGSDGLAHKQALQLENASLASQAMGPPLSATEMSCEQRRFPHIARKLLKQRPLSTQRIHPQDSLLGRRYYKGKKGLNTTYERLIKKAFAPRYWASKQAIKFDKTLTIQQIEANFSLFFGLALQVYEQTLVSDQAPFDTPRKAGEDPRIPQAFNAQQARGLKIFMDAHCALCHSGPTLSAAANPAIYRVQGADSGLVARKTLNSFAEQGPLYGLLDEGYFNTSVTPTHYDLGVGGTDPFGNPLSFSSQYMQMLLNNKTMIDPITVKACSLEAPFVKDYTSAELLADKKGGKQYCADRSLYAFVPTVSVLKNELKKMQGRAIVAVQGAFKVPSLRNVELTGPYMHNGSMLTLDQVIDFYFRGGNFKNPHHFLTAVFPQGGISSTDKADLVAFLKALTDERVRWEKAPFDHPQLLIPHGHQYAADSKNVTLAKDNFITIPAIGKHGRSRLLGPLKPMQMYLKP